MSPQYKPLDRSRREIRVITILPPAIPPTSPAGRIHNPWNFHYTDLSSLHGTGEQKASAVWLNPTDDIVRCILEHVSLDDITDDYQAYRSATSKDLSWIEFAINQGLPSNQQIVHLPAWRAAQWKQGASRDERLTGIQIPKPYHPRYNWGDFEALSYTWGTDDREGKIIVNGELTRVQNSMEAALRRLRTLPETAHRMRYWIDGLCIDQKNEAERSREVLRMGQVYKTASSVVVWLGNAANESDEACDIISGMANLTEAWIRNWKAENFEVLNWSSIYHLLNRPYWRRVWIIQELAMNRDNTTFLCGNRAFFRQELSEVFDFLESHGHRIRATGRPNPDGTIQESDLELDLRSLSQHANILLSLDARTEGNIPLSQVLDLSQHAKARDDKDKVYGILELLPQPLASSVYPDYTLPMEKVYEDFCRKVAQVMGLEFLLSWAGQPKPEPLMSWCIDMRSPFPRNHVQWLRKRHANGGSDFEWKFPPDGFLICQGAKVDTLDDLTLVTLQSDDLNIKSISGERAGPLSLDVAPDRHGDLSQTLVDTLLMEHPMRTSIRHSIIEIPWVVWPDGEDEAVREFQTFNPDWARFWNNTRILGSGFFPAFDIFRKGNASFQLGGHILKDLFPYFRPTFQAEEGGKPRSSIAWDMQLAVISLVGRRLALTVKGRLCLVPEDAQSGDMVAILDCPFPVILRLVEGGYKFIGECFVHGIMDGDASLLNEVAKEEFTLY